MISLNIKDIKQFMNKLLIKDTFDDFLLSEAIIQTSTTLTLDGQINRTFFSDEEYEALTDKSYSTWCSLKPIAFNYIKGSKAPTLMRLVFVYPQELTDKLITDNSIDIQPENINGLFINIKFQDGSLSLTTASSLKIFTLDKALDTVFEKAVRLFLNQAEIPYDEI